MFLKHAKLSVNFEYYNELRKNTFEMFIYVYNVYYNCRSTQTGQIITWNEVVVKEGLPTSRRTFATESCLRTSSKPSVSILYALLTSFILLVMPRTHDIDTRER